MKKLPRLEQTSRPSWLPALVATVLTDCGFAGFHATALTDVVDGYLVDRPMPPRAMLDSLAASCGTVSRETLADRLDAKDLSLAEYIWAKDLAGVHAFLDLW
mgnify:CR=1 FL=1